METAAARRIETERLLLRPLAMSDLEPLLALQGDPLMMRYMSDGHVHDEEETRLWLQWHIDLWEVDGYSLFAAELKEEARFVGWVGVTNPHWFPELMPTPEIGWFVERAQWGRGIATEGAQAAARFAFERLDIARLIGIYNAENLASGRVMEKIGMNFWRQIPHPRFGFPLRVYELQR
ncbi:MAG: GNAT family N-acetyltransferase [Acidimicrobiales bacterium]